jgi:hypothetical protein
VRTATVALAGILVVLGLAVIVETAVLGGGVGFLLGALLLLAGAARLYLSYR